jgi:prolipoprotein diacylglyceryltransferase
MWPEAHQLWGVQFTVYDVMRGAAVASALAVCVLLNLQQSISARKTLLIAAAVAPLSVLAARLLNAVEYGSVWGNLVKEFLRNPGSSIYGALIVCILLVLALTRVARISALRFLDAGAPGMAIGEAVSRIGCFSAGCCYGEKWNGPWAVVFPAESFAAQDQRARGILATTATQSLPVHPVQLYGVILMGLLTWVLVRQFRRPHRPGAIFLWLLISYGVYRLAITPFRMEVLVSMKVFSIIFIVTGLLGLIRNRRLSLTA